MSIINFTVEETSLTAIYKADTVATTLARIAADLPNISDEDILTIAESSSRKLAALSEPDFSALSFTHTDETDG